MPALALDHDGAGKLLLLLSQRPLGSKSGLWATFFFLVAVFLGLIWKGLEIQAGFSLGDPLRGFCAHTGNCVTVPKPSKQLTGFR